MNKKLGLQGDSGAETGFNFLLGLCTNLFMLTCTERPRSWDSIGMWLCNGEMIQGNVTCLTFLCAFGEYLTLIPIPKAGFWAWGFLCFTNHLDSCPCKHSVGALWQTLILFRALSITAGGMWVSVSKWCCTAPSLQTDPLFHLFQALAWELQPCKHQRDSAAGEGLLLAEYPK